MAMYVWAFVAALLVTYVSTPTVRNAAIRIGAVDRPDDRKIHQGAVPRLGGLAIYIGYVASALYFGTSGDMLAGALIGATVLIAVGVWDDVKQIGPKTKLLGQIVAAFIPLLFGIRVDVITDPWGHLIYLDYFAVPLTVFWIVGFTNIVNLIDGLDGLAAGISLIACLAIFAVNLQLGQVELAMLTMGLAGAACGFLRYNFNPAKIFMGDTGSMLLGYTMAVISVAGAVKTAAAVALVVPVVVLGLPILDTSFAIARRYLNGKPIFKPDKGHVHHRLLAMGMSQKRAVLLMYGITAFLGCAALIVARMNVWVGMLSFVVLICLATVAAVKTGVVYKGNLKSVGTDRASDDDSDEEA